MSFGANYIWVLRRVQWLCSRFRIGHWAESGHCDGNTGDCISTRRQIDSLSNSSNLANVSSVEKVCSASSFGQASMRRQEDPCTLWLGIHPQHLLPPEQRVLEAAASLNIQAVHPSCGSDLVLCLYPSAIPRAPCATNLVAPRTHTHAS
jgi:hypothetical protein